MSTERNTVTSGAPSAPPTPNAITAAQWLADQSTPPVPLIPVLRERFSLTTKEACQASELASRFRTLRRAFA
jgi:hypothetical protein